METNYFIVRADKAGVFFGKIKEVKANSVVMTDVQKIWYWQGACAVEQLAVDGTTTPKYCKLTVVVPSQEIMNQIQILPCSQKAVESLKLVPIWKQ